MKVEFNTTSPIYMQIIDEIKRQIVSGERKPGSKVETVRDLAQAMGVNPNTMQRAFAELEREGLMYAERTAGRYITTDQALINRFREETVRGKIAEFIEAMYQSGFDRKDILRMIEAYMEEKGNG